MKRFKPHYMGVIWSFEGNRDDYLGDEKRGENG